MSQFKYQLPSGAVFLVDAPQGTTQSQADFVFYTQVAAGTFTGYAAGQTLTSVATRLAEFNLSRVERDTAGVENATVLSIINQSPIIAPVPNLSNIPLENPVTQADIAQIDPYAVPEIGPLPPEQVAALIAQIKNLPNAEGTVTAYGFNCDQLERAGVFKPGVCSRDTFNCCLQSPDSWTGNYNVNSYNDLINNETAQVQIQAALLQNSYNSLTQAGIIQATPEPAVSITTGEVWTNARGLVEATAAGVLTGKTKSGSSLYNQVYASLTGVTSGVGAVQTALGAVTLAGAGLSSVNNLLSQGSQSISSGLGVVNSITNLGTSVQGIANNLVNTNLSSIADQGVSVLKNTINGGLNSITNTVAGSVGALMTNASQFGTAVTGLWAGGGLTGSLSSLNSLGGLANNLGLGGVASGITGITGSIGSLTNLAGGLSGSIGGLTSSLTGLSNLSSLSSLTGLTSGALGNLGGLISGSGLSNLTGLASGALGSLSGVASGALGSATSLVSGTLGNLGSLASNSLGSLTSGLDLAGKMSSFSIDFSIFSNSSLASKVQKAPAFTNTVERATVDVAFQQILGNPKIPVPNFEVPPNISTLAAQLDINYAKNILQSITSPVTNVIGQAQQVANQAIQTAQNVGGAINRLTG